ncbi:MAG: LCP family protein [Cyanobacteria bacterium P01_H01_bin.74]
MEIPIRLSKLQAEPPYSKKPKGIKPTTLLLIIFSGIVAALVIFVLINITAQVLFPKPNQKEIQIFPWQSKPLSEKVILLMGVDAPTGPTQGSKQTRNSGKKTNADPFAGTRTDTMMLVRIYAQKKRVSIVSIPRDSKVYLTGNSIGKVNAAHAIGGPEKAVQVVQDAFGIPIDNFLTLNFSGLRQLIDAIGGVDIVIEKPMRYTDRTANLFINFEPGLQHLDGKDAERFLRFRHDRFGDIGRIRRQQQFFTALAKKLAHFGNIMKLPDLFSQFNTAIETDLSQEDLMRLAFFAKQLDKQAIRSATLPGHPADQDKISYWIVDPFPAQTILDRLILDNHSSDSTASFKRSGVETKNQNLKVGLILDSNREDELPVIKNNLSRNGLNVVCTRVRPVLQALVVEHTTDTNDKISAKLQRVHPALSEARLIFNPVGTTFEMHRCSSQEDYTLYIPQKKRGF